MCVFFKCVKCFEQLAEFQLGIFFVPVVSLYCIITTADSAILKPTPLEELKTCKAYQKAIAKRDKELDNMRRKHEKVCVL